MYISYNIFWKRLNEKNMSTADLSRQTGISLSTMSKISRNENVSLSVLGRICSALDLKMSDFIDIKHKL